MSRLFLILSVLSVLWVVPLHAEAPKLELKPDDHICFIGNSLAARMSLPGHNHFEALLYQRFPKHNLVIRNLAWPADEVALRPRALGFGTPDEHLTFCKADVVMAFFGFNESFKGPAGVEQFKADLDAWIVHTQQQNYSGKGAPRLVLVSPIAAEDKGTESNPGLQPAKPTADQKAKSSAKPTPDGLKSGSTLNAVLNANLELYTKAMKEIAEKRGVVFADLFHPSAKLYKTWTTDQSQSYTPSGKFFRPDKWPPIYNLRFTDNGVHLRAEEEWYVALILNDQAIGILPKRPVYNAALLTAIADKNFHWYHRYRIVDSYYVYGGRADLKFADGDQTNRDVLQREREVLDVKVANRDQRIWDIAQGKPDTPDAANLAIHQRLNNISFPSVKFSDSSIEDIIEFVRIKQLDLDPEPERGNRGVTIELRASDVSPSPRSYNVDLTNKTLGEVLQHLASLAGLSMSVQSGRVIIGPPSRASVLPPIDDSNAPPFLDVKTFFGTGKKTDAGQNTGMTSKTAEPDAIKFLSTEESKKHFKLAPGYAIDLFASEEKFPDLGNAVSMAFDTRGRLWVSTFQSYPQWRPGGEMNDKILILEDTDHDGKADYQQTFAEGLHMPISFQFHNGGILVSHQRELLFLKDTNNDDKADIREQVLDGFDSADSHHVINSFTYGPGGDLWFQEGTFQHSQVETPWGPVRCVDAGTYRYEPRTQRLEVAISYKYANPHGIAFDKWGQLFISDASGGANYFGTAMSGYLPYPEKHNTMQQWFPKRVRPTSGCEFVSSRHFPDEAQGRFLLANCIGVRGVLQHEVKEAGSGFEGKEIEPLLLSDDPLFRPVAMTFAPDGSLYVIDWAEALIGHMQYSIRDPLRDTTHGRIWRITYPSRPLVEDPKIAGETTEKLVELLGSYEDRTRERVKQELSVRPWAEVKAALETWMKSFLEQDPDVEHKLMEALWVFQWNNVLQKELLDVAARWSNHSVRAAAVKVLCAWRDRIPNALDLLLAAAKDEHPRVRLEAVRAASWFAAPSVARLSEQGVPGSVTPATGNAQRALTPADVALAVLDYPMDYYLDYTLGETMRVLDVDVKSLKNPKAIAYVVNRLTNDELAAAPEVEPIWQARVERQGFDPVKREAAISALMQLRKQDRIAVLTDAINKLDTRGATARPAVLELGRMLLAIGPGLKAQRPFLYTMSRNAISQSFTREIAYAAVVMADGSPEEVWKATVDDVASLTMLLNAVSLIPDPALRAAFQPKVAVLLSKTSLHANIRTAALKTLPALGSDHAAASFGILKEHLKQGAFFNTAVSALSQIPKDSWDRKDIKGLAEALLQYCAKIPADQRTDDAFIDAQQLGIDMASLMPDGEALGKQLRGLGVATVLIKCLREQMIYDKLTFEVEAGKPVAIILENTDIMPHNFVIVQPGALEEIGNLSMTQKPVPDKQGRMFVPDSPKILAATKMLEPGQREKFTWTAPSTPGKVPFLCTFPGHWVRMKGEIVVR